MATRKRKSVVDSGVRNAALLSDGCNPELVKGAEFDGLFEIPIIKKPKKIIIPTKLVPFSKMDKADKKTFAVCEYENDAQLKHIFRDDKGHLPDTPENRKMLLDLANDEKFHKGKDKWGNDWHIRQNEDGTQDWTRSRNLSIDEGGKNQKVITWDDETGLFKNLKGKLRRDRK